MAGRGIDYRVTDKSAPKRQLARGVNVVARQLARDAASFTPVRTGRLRAGWRVEQAGTHSRVVNDVPYARAVEYGSRRANGTLVPPVAMMGRALARARARGGRRGGRG
jgi:hypothetical protein